MCRSIVKVVKAVSCQCCAQSDMSAMDRSYEALTKATLADQLEGCAAKPLQHIELLRACFDSGQNSVAELGNINVSYVNATRAFSSVLCTIRCKRWAPCPASVARKRQG